MQYNELGNAIDSLVKQHTKSGHLSSRNVDYTLHQKLNLEEFILNSISREITNFWPKGMSSLKAIHTC